jgi:DNA replication licensing factor MCM5
LPSTCAGPNSEECGRFPYTVDPDQSRFVDQQTVKLQEAPETVPVGELPRSVVTVVDRALVDRAPPGTRVSLLCIPTLMPGGGGRNGRDSTAQAVYLRVVGMIQENDAHGPAVRYTPAEEEAFTRLAARPDVYDILLRSTAPNIQGSYTVDIKKAMLCQLMGGSSKRLPDGMRLRGRFAMVVAGFSPILSVGTHTSLTRPFFFPCCNSRYQSPLVGRPFHGQVAVPQIFQQGGPCGHLHVGKGLVGGRFDGQCHS